MARNAPASTDIDARFAPLTEDDIERKANASNLKAVRTHFRTGHIQDPFRRGNIISAICIGSTIVPFEVDATLAHADDAGANASNVHCTCSQSGYCQHVVALLLAWADDPDQFETRTDIDELLGDKSREELIDLVKQLAERYPEIEGYLEMPLPLLTGEAEPAAPNEVTVSVDSVRRQVRSAFIGLDDDAGNAFAGGSLGLIDFAFGLAAYNPDMLDSVIALGDIYVNAEQWANAQAVFTVLADETGHALTRISDREGYLAECFAKCDDSLALCLDAQLELSEDERLSDDARRRLIRTLYDIWREDMYVLGDINISYEGPTAIARNVTDAERAMVEQWLQAEPGADWALQPRIELLVALRRQAGLDDEEELGMYRDAGMHGHVAMMLLSRERVDEAVAEANRHLKDPSALLDFAIALIERGGDDVSRALSMVDDRAWEIEGTHPLHEAMLQNWLASQYQAYGRPGEALAIAERRFRQYPSRHSFNAVRRAAGLPGQEPDAWSNIRPALVEYLREQQVWSALVELSLDEGDVDAALDAVDNSQKRGKSAETIPEDLLLRLTETAEREHPERAVDLYRQL